MTSMLAMAALLFCVQSLTAPARTISSWSRIEQGIEYAWGTDTSPRPMTAYAMRVHLLDPEVSLYASPSNGSGSLEVYLQTTPDFLSQYGCKIACNANFFSPLGSSGTAADAWGLAISNGSTVSPGQTDWRWQLLIDSYREISVAYSASTPTGIRTGLGAGNQIVSDGVNIGTSISSDITAHTCIGYDAEKKYMIIVVVDKNRPGVSEGAHYHDMGDWMLDFGAYDALNFDGGGSSCLARDSGVINVPSDGSPRPVAINLGVMSADAVNNIGLSATSQDSTHIDMLERGTFKNVAGKSWNSTSGWSDWSMWSANYNTNYAPAITSSGTGNLDAFVVDSATTYMFWRSCRGGTWGSWAQITGGFNEGPSAASWATNRVDVVGRGNGAENDIYHRYWNGSAWSSWANLCTSPRPNMNSKYAPALCSWGTDRLDLFIIDNADTHMKHLTYSGGAWGTTWTSLEGGFTAAPAAVSWASGRIDVFGRGNDNHIYHKFYNSGAWSASWEDMGSLTSAVVAAGSPTACSRGTNRLDVFVRGSDGQLYQKVWDGSNWSGWTSLGSAF